MSSLRVDDLEVLVAPRETPPFLADGWILEEDTYLALSADREIRETNEHPIRIMTGLLELSPRALGSTIASMGRPPRILCVVHDLEQDPTVSPDIILPTVDRALDLVETLGWRTLGLELLGSTHGRIDPRVSLSRSLLRIRAGRPRLERLWVMTKDPEEILGTLASLIG